ncbi:response regulator [Stutzerimonas zhaodongensis]|uniref:histidine kinase n=1 Tax=Stutzerimonas zhaodongensis TaxID=1176257 RepID=A0A3M2HWG7_9GAMM|nr:response regulator [Stutzerimonas zhaodongensis]MCQ2028755.1 response regulator [Stutzerimonas zhaodongensis]MCQ4315278.1 response regulator [Stutzerimonas zhaodongensis]RMH90154.1 response regulator [Stutzerimonas zhaodongensis]
MTTPTKPEHPIIVVYAPIGRDGPATAELLRRSGMDAVVCHGVDEVLQRAETDAAAVFIAEEGLFGHDLKSLSDWVDHQPTWSDFPFVVLTSKHQQPAVAAWRQRMVAALRNVSLLERPVQSITLTSAIQAAVRGRLRQYEVRALIEAREKASQELEALVVERTSELEKTNLELRTQMAERAHIEETLRQTQKIEAIGQLTGGIAHDFNNLLMVISGGLDMLDRRADPERRKRLMDGMRQAAQRGSALTRQLLAFSRRQSLAPEPVDLAQRITQMRELLDRSLRGDVQVKQEFAPDLWPVEVDPGELELVILNLAVNARDAMPEGGNILLQARNAPDELVLGRRGDFVRLAVIDTGTGIPDEVRNRVFDPFFTTKEIGKGSGLGLAQVYGFARQSGGTVWIDSECGQGTSVVMLLPRSADLPSPIKDQPPADDAVNLSAGNVLLVDDDEEVAALVAEMLEHLGYQVTSAASAAAALGALANGRGIDIVFSDVMMPGGMNGLELAREIRTRNLDVPVLLTSGYAEAVKRSAETEGVQILAKPYRLEELAAALKTALERIEA